MSTMDDYLAKARAALEGMQPRLDELRVQADQAQGTAKERIQAGIVKVQEAQAKAKAQLDQAARSGQGTWKSAARQADKTLNEVEAQLQSLADQVQSSVSAAAPAARRAWTAFLDEWNRGRRDRERLLDDKG
jgi:chromosome segregation ATPase